jgi:hypothetical protein
MDPLRIEEMGRLAPLRHALPVGRGLREAPSLYMLQLAIVEG